MAVINTIREKMGTVVVVVIGLAIASFVIADLLGPNSRLFNDVDDTVGEVAGEEITIKEFRAKVEQLEAQFAARFGGTLTEAQRVTVRNTAWDALIAEKAFGEQYEELGLQVSNEEVVDMVQGQNISPELQQAFTNPETGEFDRSRLINYLQSVKNDPNAYGQWVMYEANLRPGRERLKYENLLIKTDYVTTAEAKREYMNQNAVAEIQYLYVPFHSVSDSAVKVTDTELKEYLNKNKERYKGEASRSIKYVLFPVQPSKEDEALFQQELNKLKNDFQAAKNDSLFAVNNTEGTQGFATYTPDMLPAPLQNMGALTEGEVYGPVKEGDFFALYKLTKVTKDTVQRARASHILIRADESAPAEQRTEARKKAENLLKELQGGADFAKVARENSDDPSASRGGDLGWFPEGRMVEPFEKAVFTKNEAGLVNKVVETRYGYHIIKVTEPKTNTVYKVAKVETELAPSEYSRNMAYRKAETFASQVNSLDQFQKVAETDTITVREAKNLDKNASRINALADARPIVMWAFNKNTDVSEVSEVFETEEGYVVAVLTDKRKEGVANIDDVRDEITAKVKNDKKAEIIKEKLASLKGSLEEMAKSYGPDANVYTASDVNPSAFSLSVVGYAPKAIGAAFGLKEGEVSKPVEAQNGIVVVKTISKTEAPEVADYSSFKEQVKQRLASRTPYLITEAVKEKANVEDERYKFF